MSDHLEWNKFKEGAYSEMKTDRAKILTPNVSVSLSDKRTNLINKGV